MRSIVIAILGLAAIALAGCATTQSRTARAAERLERSADALAAGLPAAQMFAEQAREFRETVDSEGDQQVVFAFEHLWRSYHTLRDQVYRSRDPQLRADLKPTTKAFVDVQRHVKTGYSDADPTLYASGGYFFDPIYN